MLLSVKRNLTKFNCRHLVGAVKCLPLNTQVIVRMLELYDGPTHAVLNFNEDFDLFFLLTTRSFCEHFNRTHQVAGSIARSYFWNSLSDSQQFQIAGQVRGE